MIQESSNYSISSNTKDDGIHKLFFTHYRPEEEKKIKATLLVVHGMMEHSGRYSEFARFMAEHGIAVVAYDHLGHGKTAQKPEDFGFFAKKNAREQVVTDAENMAAYLELKYPYVPHFILGHSMGSFITRCLLQIAQERFDGAIIVGSGDKIKGIKLLKFTTTILNKIAPGYHNKAIQTAFNKLNNARFKDEVNQENTNWLSENSENRAAFLNDELCGIPFTHNGYHTLASLNFDATKKDWAKHIMRKFPLFFVSGNDDPIGEFGKGIERMVTHLKNDGFQTVDMKLYPNMRHEVLNEKNRIQVFEDINQWIFKQIGL